MEPAQERRNLPQHLTISALRDLQGATRNYVSLFTDIGTQKQHQQELEYIAHHDALPNLPNRFLPADRMHQAMAQSGSPDAMKRTSERHPVAILETAGLLGTCRRHGFSVTESGEGTGPADPARRHPGIYDLRRRFAPNRLFNAGTAEPLPVSPAKPVAY